MTISSYTRVMQVGSMTLRMAGNMADRDFIARFREGDREAFADLYRVHHTNVLRFALTRSKGI